MIQARGNCTVCETGFHVSNANCVTEETLDTKGNSGTTAIVASVVIVVFVLLALFVLILVGGTTVILHRRNAGPLDGMNTMSQSEQPTILLSSMGGDNSSNNTLVTMSVDGLGLDQSSGYMTYGGSNSGAGSLPSHSPVSPWTSTLSLSVCPPNSTTTYSSTHSTVPPFH